MNDDLLKGGKKKVRTDSGVGIKPISIFGTKRLVRYAIRQRALETGRKTVTLVHKGNIQKFTEGAFREWGYEVATEEFRDQTVTERESWILGNVEAKPGLTVEENAALIEPGLEFGSPGIPRGALRRDQGRSRLHRQVARQRRVEVRRSSSTTASPTPSSSRSSFARRTTASSPHRI